MNYRLLAPFLLLLVFLQVAAAAENTTTGAMDSDDGIVRVPSIDLIIDSSGLVSVKEELIVRRGELVELTIFSDVQGLQLVDSKNNKVVYNLEQADGNQRISFILESAGNISEEGVILNYDTQGLTSKTGGLWNITYAARVTPLGSNVSGTVIRILAPNNTRILNISIKDFYWSLMGTSGMEIYPLIRDFSLSFIYKLGVSGPIYPGPNETTSTTTTTLPGNPTAPWDQLIERVLIQINNIYYILVFGVILAFLLGVFSVYLKHRRAKEELKLKGAALEKANGGVLTDKPAESSSIGGGFSVESVNHDFEVVQPSTSVGSSVSSSEVVKANGSDDKEELVDAPVAPVKASRGPRRLKESIRNVLDETELKVVDMLLKYENEITQAYIYKTTGIPKSSLSDTIKRLEKRNIIDRKKDGRINWIKLKDAVLD